MHKVRGPSVY